MINELKTLLTAQIASDSILAQSNLPIEIKEEFIVTTSNLLVVALNMTKVAFGLNDDQTMALLILVILRIMEMTDE